MEPSPIDIDSTVTPGLLRRLAAILYDSLLLLSLLVIAAGLATWFSSALLDSPLDPTQPLYRGYLILVTLIFYLYFWVKGGQTLGMRAWRLRVVRDDGTPLHTKDALLRYGAALLSWGALGAGFVWCLLDPEGLAWHDRLSGTRLVMTARPQKG